MDWVSKHFSKHPKRRFPIRRDAEGRSARTRAFGFFDEGLRPYQLPDIGVPPRTLYRYFESWKHRDRDARDRMVTLLARGSPELQQELATAYGFSLAEVAEAFEHRNSKAALQRKIRDHLLLLLDRLDNMSANEMRRVGVLLHAYKGRDRTALLDRFVAWVEPVLERRREGDDKVSAVLAALIALGDDVREIGRARRQVRAVFLGEPRASSRGGRRG